MKFWRKLAQGLQRRRRSKVVTTDDKWYNTIAHPEPSAQVSSELMICYFFSHTLVQTYFYFKSLNKRPTGHGSLPSDIATADMQMLCNIFPILSSQLMKRSLFKQFLILKNIYGMPVNGAWSFEQMQNGGQLGFTIGTIFAIFDLRVTPMLPTKFRVNWPFSSEEEAKNRCSRWLPWRPSWISDWHDFSYFFIYKSPQCLLTSLESIGLSVQEKQLNIEFQDCGHGGHLGFQIGMILAIFDLQVTQMLPTKFRVNWLLGLGEEAKIDFQDSRHGGHLGFDCVGI